MDLILVPKILVLFLILIYPPPHPPQCPDERSEMMSKKFKDEMIYCFYPHPGEGKQEEVPMDLQEQQIFSQAEDDVPERLLVQARVY